MEKLFVYKYDKKDYLRGFDYALVYDVNMGIDSKIRYYQIDIDDLKKRIGEENILYRDMNREQESLIAKEFYNEKEERLRRIKGASNHDLADWRLEIMHGITNGYADQTLLIDIDEEIARRKKYQETHGNLRRELLSPLKKLADELKKDNFNKDLVGEQIEELQKIFNISLERENRRKK